MFTQCSNCDTVFRLSAETLRAAGGQVRCGRCGEIFNALARLAEDASVFPRRESAIEMEKRADEILHSKPELAAKPSVAPQRAAPPTTATPPTPATAPTPATPPTTAAPTTTPSSNRASPPGISDSAPAEEETSFEFTLPPGELDRVFVEITPRSRSAIPAAALALSEAAAEDLADPVSESLGRQVSGFEVSEDVRREMLDSFESQPLLELAATPPRPRSFFVWLGAAIVLALLLLGQMIRENRVWLAQHAPLRGPLRSLYAAIGVGVQMPANLSAYQLRQWGVTGDPAAAGTLRVRASILNSAPQLQPYPLLRVTLANRFGARIGTRDFEPAEYLGKPTVRMLAPGERADATLDILDPGKDAEGFEIDVCLRGADQKISCGSDVAPQGTP